MDRKMAEKMTMVLNRAVEVGTVADPAPEVAMVVDAPVGVAIAPDELHPEVKVQLARMEPIFHDTFLSILKNLFACMLPTIVICAYF
jgi:hypothetical protein